MIFLNSSNRTCKAFVSLICLLSVGFQGPVYGQLFQATYNFSGVSTQSGRIDPTVPPTAPGITFSVFSAIAPANNAYGLSANPNASGRFSFTGWPRGATNNTNTFTGSLVPEQYYEVTLTPQQFYQLQIDSIAFTMQRSATGIRQYAVRSSVDGFANNLQAKIEPGNDNLGIVNSNVFQVTDAVSTAQTGSKVLPGANGNNTAPVTFRFYGFNAEASAGSFSLDDVVFYGSSTFNAAAPLIVLDPTALAFAATPSGTISQKSYTVQATNLTQDLKITSTAPFTIATSSNGPFATELLLDPATAANANTIFVRFAPVSLGSFSASIRHTSGNATEKIVQVNGDGVDPNNLNFSFDDCTVFGVPGTGFFSYSTAGAQRWACTGFGVNGTHGVDVNGYSGGAAVENEDWLISPALHLNGLGLPVLSFYTRGEFTGPNLQVLISTDYDGGGDPNQFTWNALPADIEAPRGQWKLTDGVDLSAYKGNANLYIAFKYTSSVETGAARWTVDEVNISNRTQLVNATPASINFGEVTSGSISASLPVVVKGVGYGDLAIEAPAGYQLSLDNTNFSSSILVAAASLSNGATVYARFAPQTKQLTISGVLRISSSSLDTSLVTLSGSSYPKAETFDAGTYNLSFFGSNPTNNPTPQKITTQVQNIATVLQRLNLDIVGVEEISNDVALDSLVSKLPKRKAILSNRWSQSYNPPDPNFPPQKLGFIYDTTTSTLVESRAMFASLYDSARSGYPQKLPNYPGGAASFWASGRLPFMATFDVQVNGITKRVRMIVIHAKSSTDAASYNRRVYDAKVLLDTLNTYYKDDAVMIVGDYNDRLAASTYLNGSSPYKDFVTQTNTFTPLTLPLDQAGKKSYVSGTSMIDHLITTKTLSDTYISNSTTIEDPSLYLTSYTANSASDHYPVFARFNFSNTLPVTFLQFKATAMGTRVGLQWAVTNQQRGGKFIVQRSVKNNEFKNLQEVQIAANATTVQQYEAEDLHPAQGANYYRLKQVDPDGAMVYSGIVKVSMDIASLNVAVYPNPFTKTIQFRSLAEGTITATLTDVNGKRWGLVKASASKVEQWLNQRFAGLPAGLYVLECSDAKNKSSLKLLKQ